MRNEYLNNKTFESIIDSFQKFKKQKLRYEFVLKDIKETSERRKRLGIAHNEKKDLEIIEHYKQVCVEFKKYQDDLTRAFYILSENLANYVRHYGIDTDDSIQEGVLICFEKIDRFDSRKGKAFNYMTTCVLNHYRQIYRSGKNYNELKKRYYTHLQGKFESIFFRNGKERTSSKNAIDELMNAGN